MMRLNRFIRFSLLLMCVCYSGSCSSSKSTEEIILVGSTPGDEAIKSMLSIPIDSKVDFIKWSLKLDYKNSFILEIKHGESKPNTLDFKGGGKSHTFKGMFTISNREKNSNFKEVYTLMSDSLPEIISFVMLNENVFHLLTPENQLMIGNGGWSYSLNRYNPVDSDNVLISSTLSDEKSLQLVYDGRTPCQEIAAEHSEMNISNSCFKLKWRLILNRDPVTYLPTTYTIRKIVDNQPIDVTGKWTIIKGTNTNPDVIIYKIEPDRPDESISFLVGDDNVLFFLNKNNELFVGNENFSFALNKKM